MTEAKPPLTHNAFLYRTDGMRKGMRFGRWLHGGEGRLNDDGNFDARIDMTPTQGWDGRIRFIKIGDKPPAVEVPQRPGTSGDSEEESQA